MTGETRAVLVTGAGTGIGRHLTEFLAERGIQVFATARKDVHLEELAKIEGVVPIRMDVRDNRQVAEARRTVDARGTRLYGLVNNAGIGWLGQLGTVTDEELREIFDVNVFGLHRVTTAFLDLILQARGRIVNIGSQGGILTKSFFGPYTMTKHAVEAYTGTLDCELRPHGVRASVVQPGAIESAIGEHSLDITIAHLRRAVPPFDVEAAAYLDAILESNGSPGGESGTASERRPSSPVIVAAAVEHALFADEPNLRYLVGTRWEGDRVIRALLERLVEANASPSHGLSRDELVRRLDDQLASRGSARALGS